MSETVADLGRKAKKKRPDLRHLSDEEAGRQVKREYPGVYDRYEEIGLSTRQDQSITHVHQRNNEHLERLLNEYRPNMGRFGKWLHGRKIPHRIEFIDSVSSEMQALIRQGAILEDEVNRQMRSQIEYQNFLIHNEYALLELKAKYEMFLIAIEKGLSVDSYDEVQKQHYLGQNEILLERQRSEIRVEEHDKKSQIDLNRTLQEKQETVRLALISKHLSDIQKIALVQEQIDEVYKQINDIESGKIVSSNNAQLSETVKQLMIEDRKEVITTLQELRRARQRRLLEIDNGGEFRGIDETPDLR